MSLPSAHTVSTRPPAVTTSSPERGKRLRALGATHVLDRDGAGEGPAEFDVILDVVGGSGLPAFIGRLAPNGRLVAVGIVGGQPPADFGTAILSAFRRSIWFGTLSLDTVPRADLARVRAGLPQLHASAPSLVLDGLDDLDDGVLATVRRHPSGPMVGLYNVTSTPRPVPVHRLHEAGLTTPYDALGGRPLAAEPDGTTWLPPYAALWLVDGPPG